jgi:hypothetical protein
MPTFFSTRVGDAFACVWKEEGEFASRAVYSLTGKDYGTDMIAAAWVFRGAFTNAIMRDCN